MGNDVVEVTKVSPDIPWVAISWADMVLFKDTTMGSRPIQALS